MSKWRFEPMPLEEARRILAGEKTLDNHADRISAHHLVERRYADDGWAPAPITSIYERCGHCNGTGYQRGGRCGMCRGKGYFETERVR